MQNRRNFIKNTLLAGTGIACMPYFSACTSATTPSSFILGGITPFSILFDALSIVKNTKDIPDTIIKNITTNLNKKTPGNFVGIAMSFPADNIRNQRHLNELIAKKTEIQNDSFLSRKLAFTLGEMIASTVHSTFAKTFTKICQGDITTASEMQMYQDCWLLTEIYKEEKSPDEKDIYQLIFSMMPRAIGRMHTLEPDPDDGENWVVRMTDWRIKNKENIAAMAKLCATFDEAKTEKYIAKPNFYDADDSVFSLLNANEPIEISIIDKANSNNSLYGKALYGAIKEIYTVANQF